MALIFMDGFDHYTTTADGTSKWLGGFSGSSSSTTRYNSGKSWLNGDLIRTLSGNPSAFVCGCAVQWSTIGYRTSDNTVIRFRDGTTDQISICVGAGNALTLIRGTTAITGGTSTSFVFRENVWYYIEWKVTIADSIAADSCIVKVNGQTVINLPATSDTKQSANTYANNFAIRNPIGGNMLVDDVYLCDQSGSVNNDFLGEMRVETLIPNADGDLSQFTNTAGNSTTNYTYIDDAAQDGDTTYVETGTVGNRDCYNLPNLSASYNAVAGIQVGHFSRKTIAGARTMSPFVRLASTNYDGAAVTLASSYAYYSEIWNQNPNTSTAWTTTDINNLQIGSTLVS